MSITAIIANNHFEKGEDFVRPLDVFILVSTFWVSSISCLTELDSAPNDGFILSLGGNELRTSISSGTRDKADQLSIP